MSRPPKITTAILPLPLRAALALPALLAASGCASLFLGPAADQLGHSLGRGILDQDDPQTVEAGLPAWLLLLDGLIADAPDDAALRLSAAKLYSAYGGSLIEDPARRRRLSARGLDHARRALCLSRPQFCDLPDRPAPELAAALGRFGPEDIALLHGLGTAWSGWVQAHSEDWNAVAALPRIEAVMQRVVALDESYERGAAHLYLGVLAGLLPPALGGRPQAARAHFERALALSGGRNLMAPALLAEYVARPLLDRPLHDRLLHEVLAADPRAPGLTLTNVLAQRRARQLLQTADQFF